MNIDHSKHSPNFSPRNGADISMIVLHATVGSGASALAWLCNPASKVSTHYLIYKTGYIYQLVADNLAAWHAGVSQWFDLDSGEIMRQSLGIELENKNNGVDKYPEAQMAALLELSRALVAQYKIVPDMVTRHLDVAIPKGRKTDPAGFPWLAFKAALYAPLSTPYRVGRTPIYQRADHTGTVAGWADQGEVVQIDNPANGHLASGLGFINPDCLEAI
jgi:N-acetylmuramoyl-L-alanine amidase